MPSSAPLLQATLRALPEHELRVADVAFVRRERLDARAPDDNLHGAPDLVIEILSPSNTVAEIYAKEKLCLENGAQEFWVIDPDRRQVKVSTPDGRTVTYPSWAGDSAAAVRRGETHRRCRFRLRVRQHSSRPR